MQKCLKLKKLQMEIIKKVSKLELFILCTVCLFMWVYNPTRYHPNILNSFEVIEHTQKFVKKMQREITRKLSKLELCHLCAACLIIWIYISIKVHPNTLNSLELWIYKEICEKINLKNTYLQKKTAFFTKKIGNQLKRTWYHIKAETLKKPCVKFEEGRLNTLRENRIC